MYAMFRLAGENDAESILKFKVQAQFLGCRILYSRCSCGAGGWGWGFNTPSQSLLNAYEPGDVRKMLLLCSQELYDGRFYLQQ
jgi:hypothetical protein